MLAAGLLVAIGLFFVYKAKDESLEEVQRQLAAKSLTNLNELNAREDLLPALGPVIADQRQRDQADRKIFALSGSMSNVGRIRGAVTGEQFRALKPVFIVRLFNTVGPRQTGHYGMVVPTFVRQALDGAPLTVYGTGQQKRCFCSALDVVEGLVRLPEVEAATGMVVNLGSQNEISIENLARRVVEVTGSSSGLCYVPYEEAYGSGFEDRPRLLEAMARRVPLLGNSGPVVARVKDPADFAATCRTLGIPHPEIRFEGCAEAGWVEKRCGAAGGLHVQRATAKARRAGTCYLQRYAEGAAVSALFLADGRRALVLGFSEQWCDPTPRHPFRYGGCARPASVPLVQVDSMRETVARIVLEYGLRGLNSADFLVRADGYDLLEINPRPGATLDIFRHPSLFRLHVEACRGRMPDRAPAFRGAAAAVVVYAPARLILKPGFLWPDWTADRQDAGKPVESGAPLCTVVARARSTEAARLRVMDRAQSILASAAA